MCITPASADSDTGNRLDECGRMQAWLFCRDHTRVALTPYLELGEGLGIGEQCQWSGEKTDGVFGAENMDKASVGEVTMIMWACPPCDPDPRRQR